MFENLKTNIAKELNNSYIDSIESYVYELHEILPKYLVNVPEQSDYEFYEFAGKFMQYLIDEKFRAISEIDFNICQLFANCYIEICNVTCALASCSGEDITDDVIKILSNYQDGQIITSDEAEETLDKMFSFTNHDWKNMSGVNCNWNQVCETLDIPEYNIKDESETIHFNDSDIAQFKRDGVITDWYEGPGLYNLDTYELIKLDDDKEDETEFEISGLFSFQCVTGTKSAAKALEVIYKDCGYIGYPEEDIEAGYDFPGYGIIDQDEADWFNSNMSAILDYYNGNASEYALKQIDSEAEYLSGDELNDEDSNIIDQIEEDLQEDYDYEITYEELDEYLEEHSEITLDADTIYEELKNRGWNVYSDNPEPDRDAGYEESDYNDEDENDDNWLTEAEEALLEEYDYEITKEDIINYLEENREDYTSGDVEVLKDYLDANGWSITSSEDSEYTEMDSNGDITYGLINTLEEKYPNCEITYDELLDEYNESGISHLISMFNVAEILDGQGWSITEIPDYAETFKERFGNNSDINDEFEVVDEFVNYLDTKYSQEISLDDLDSERADYINNVNLNLSDYSIDTIKDYLENNDWTVNEDKFIATGYKTTSNLGDKEIQINDSGDEARIKFEDDTISDWCEILTDTSDCDDMDDFSNMREYIDPVGNEDYDDFEFLDEYMKY